MRTLRSGTHGHLKASKWTIFLSFFFPSSLRQHGLKPIGCAWHFFTPIGSNTCQSKSSLRCPPLPPRQSVCFYPRRRAGRQGSGGRSSRIRSLTFDAEKTFLLHDQLSRCFFLRLWRTCIILSRVETDCTPPGVVDVAMSGRGPSSWEHGTWYVKWLMGVS